MSRDANARAAGRVADVRLECAWCETARPADLDPWCASCGGTLRAVLASSGARPTDLVTVTLGEGRTPLLPIPRAAGPDAWVKAEWINPTGSFKDRGSAVALSVAVALGTAGVVVASAGNNAASVSAYAARAGLPCVAVLPASTPRNKVIQALANGATVARVAGDFSDAYQVAELVRRETGWVNMTSTYLNPYMTAAHASIAVEIAEALDGVIGTIVVPVGAGPMLEGITEGFERLVAEGSVAHMPLVIGVQASGCAPIVAAFERGDATVAAWPGPPTSIASSINDPLRGYPDDGTRTLRAVRRVGGVMVAVDDAAVTVAMRDLGGLEGMAIEPASAATLAGLRALEGMMELPRPVVLVLSGHVLKDPAQVIASADDSPVLDAEGILALVADLAGLAGPRA
jgi:threonine synthase